MPEKPIIINDFSLGMCISHLGKLHGCCNENTTCSVRDHTQAVYSSPVIYSNNLTSVFKIEMKNKRLLFNFLAEYIYYDKFNSRQI